MLNRQSGRGQCQTDNAIRHEPAVYKPDLKASLRRIRCEDYIHIAVLQGGNVFRPGDIDILRFDIEIRRDDIEQNGSDSVWFCSLFVNVHFRWESGEIGILELYCEADFASSQNRL